MKAKLHSIGWMFRFVRPLALFIPALLVYGGQGFAMSLISSLFNRWLTEGMMAGDSGMLWRYTGIAIAIYFGYFILLGIMVWQFVRCEELAGRAMKHRLFRAFVTASVEGRAHSGEGIAALNTEAGLASEVISNAMASFLGCVIAIIGSGAVIFSVDVRLGLLALAIGLVALLIQSRFSGPLERLARKRLDENAAATKTMTTLLIGAATVRIFNLQPRVMREFAGSNDGMLRVSFKEAFIAMVHTALTTVQGWLSLAGVFGLGGWLVATGRLELAALMMVPSLCVTLADGMGRIGAAWAGVQGPIVAAGRLEDIIRTGEQAEDISRAKQGRMRPWDGDTTLVADHLTFRYLGAHTDALDDVSLRIGRNEMVALVGASGSGKSTLLRALTGLYERDALDISLGNLSFRNTPADVWREHFAYVDQRCTLFSMTAAENIALGKAGATHKEVAEAAVLAGADGFLRALPQGYDTPCGEGGASLSGGQRQRIAIARALVRKAPVLVFDEAASALDAESARQVMDTIRRLRRDHTILITTHDLPSISDADRIIVLREGRIVQSGTHGDLLREGGEYVRLLKGER